jgi:hypothetical protein
MVDFNKLNTKLQNVEAKRVDRDYIGEGRHIVRLVGAETRETQAGKELAIIEADVIASNGQHTEGSGVKQLFPLSNEPAWRIDQSLGLIRAMINAACPGEQIDGDFLASCLSGGNQSALSGRTLMVIAKRKISKNEKAYLDFSYKSASEKDADTLRNQAPVAATVAQAPRVISSSTANEAQEDHSQDQDDDEPPFDL